MKKYLFFLFSSLAMSGCANITPYGYYNKPNYKKSSWKFKHGYNNYKKNEKIISLSYKKPTTRLRSEPDNACYISWIDERPGPREPRDNYKELNKFDSSESNALINNNKKYYTYNIQTYVYSKICDYPFYQSDTGSCPRYSLLGPMSKQIGLLFSENGKPISIVSFGHRLALSGYPYKLKRTNCKFHLINEKFVHIRKDVYYEGYNKNTGKISFKETSKNHNNYFTINPPYKNTKVDLLHIYNINSYHKAYLYIKSITQNGQIIGKIEIKNGTD